MPLEFLFGIAILMIVLYIVVRIIGNVALGALLVLIVFLASYVLLGSFPSLENIPLIGNFIPTTGKASTVIQPKSMVALVGLIVILILVFVYVISRKPHVKK